MTWEEEVAVEGIHPRYGDGRTAPEEADSNIGRVMLTLAFFAGLAVGLVLGRL